MTRLMRNTELTLRENDGSNGFEKEKETVCMLWELL